MMTARVTTCFLILSSSFLPLLFSASANATGVHVALRPESIQVSPGEEFEIGIHVPVAGDLFNAYDATVAYDDAALTFLPVTPISLQEGEYMKNACGVTFYWFQENAGSLEIGHSLWCASILLPGPGELQVLRFRASAQPQVTEIRISHTQFFSAGYEVAVASVTNATVIIGPVAVEKITWGSVKSLYDR